MLVYGEAETGKSTLAIQCAVNCARMGYKTIFVACEDTFFTRRMEQIASDDFEAIASQIILMHPEDFEQQGFVIDNLNRYVSKKVGLIVVDTITSLYRERLGDDVKKTFSLNRELNRQMACLTQITKTQKLVSLVVSQVRSVVLDERELVQPVATRVLEFWADTILSLKLTTQTTVIKVSVKTHGNKNPVKSIFLRIGEKGLHDYRA